MGSKFVWNDDDVVIESPEKDLKEGSWVTIDDRPVFIGGPGEGGGGAAGVSSFAQAAGAGAIASDSPLAGGTFGPRLIEYQDDGKGVWKPIDAGHGFHDGNSEVAQYRLSRLLGEQDVPETVYANNRAGEPGASQSFIAYSSGTTLGDLDADRDAADRIVAVDFIAGQGDRHGGNLLSGPGGKVWAVDNGHASWFDQRYPNNRAFVMNKSRVVSGVLALDAAAREGPEALERARARGVWEPPRQPHGTYTLGADTLARLRGITREAYDSAFAGVGTEVHVRPEMGWSNLQWLLESNGVIEW